MKHTVTIVARKYPFTPRPTVTSVYGDDCMCAEAVLAAAIALRPGVEQVEVRHDDDGELCPLFVEAQQYGTTEETA